MTDAGKAKFAAFDPLQHPASNCQTPGWPSIAPIPRLQKWIVATGRVVIRHESWETIRIVSLGEVVHPVEDHSMLGRAIGEFRGDTR